MGDPAPYVVVEMVAFGKARTEAGFSVAPNRNIISGSVVFRYRLATPLDELDAKGRAKRVASR